MTRKTICAYYIILSILILIKFFLINWKNFYNVNDFSSLYENWLQIYENELTHHPYNIKNTSKTRQMLKIHAIKSINSDENLEDHLTKLKYLHQIGPARYQKIRGKKSFTVLKWHKWLSFDFESCLQRFISLLPQLW